VLGKEHPSTLTTINNLAGVLRDQRKYEQAEIWRQALRLMKSMPGKEHPDTDEHGQPSGGAEGPGQVRPGRSDRQIGVRGRCWARASFHIDEHVQLGGSAEPSGEARAGEEYLCW
jgi:hypothetical protein